MAQKQVKNTWLLSVLVKLLLNSCEWITILLHYVPVLFETSLKRVKKLSHVWMVKRRHRRGAAINCEDPPRLFQRTSSDKTRGLHLKPRQSLVPTTCALLALLTACVHDCVFFFLYFDSILVPEFTGFILARFSYGNFWHWETCLWLMI